MALPGYLKIVGSLQGPIQGECEADDTRDASIVVQGVDHSVKLPTDSRGLPNGKRVHLPLTIIKEVDRSSPMLYQALSEGEPLTTVTIDWYRTDNAGNAELYFIQVLKNAQITSINFFVDNILDPATNNFGHHEKVSFIYDEIIWKHEVSAVEFEDNMGSV